jgi:hypothetical protein
MRKYPEDVMLHAMLGLLVMIMGTLVLSLVAIVVVSFGLKGILGLLFVSALVYCAPAVGRRTISWLDSL